MTILTPTYNRAYILKNAYESLLRQTDKGFEWIIVDDGSSDDTELVVKAWIDVGAPFEIKYFKQKNGGKHRAVNKGVSESSYDYVLILDSDDYLTDDAVEKIHGWTKSIEGLDGFAGVAGLRGRIENSSCIGGGGNGEAYIDAKNTERGKYNLSGDKAEVYKVEILKKYPFPEFEGENFLSEHVVWDTIANDGYKIRWFTEVVYKCEYLADGLTNGGDYEKLVKNFNGYTLSAKLKKELQPFPINYLTVGIFDYVASLRGIDVKQRRKLLSVNAFELLIGRCIFNANRLKNKVKGR